MVNVAFVGSAAPFVARVGQLERLGELMALAHSGTATGVIIGGVIVAPVASELILPIAMAVQNGLSVEDLAHTFSVYPSLSGSITEAGRQLMRHGDLD